MPPLEQAKDTYTAYYLFILYKPYYVIFIKILNLFSLIANFIFTFANLIFILDVLLLDAYNPFFYLNRKVWSLSLKLWGNTVHCEQCRPQEIHLLTEASVAF